MTTQTDFDVILEFLAESRENMDQMERDLVAWEKLPGSRDLVDRIFRAVHTLKGTCGFLGLARLETISHDSENLLALLRDGKILASPRIVTVLLQVIDVVRRQLEHLEKTGQEDSQVFGCVLADLQALQEVKEEQPASPSLPEVEVEVEAEATSNVREGSSIRVDVGLLDRLMNLVGELVLARNHLSELNVEENPRLLVAAAQKLGFITSELQEGVMKTRLQMIGHIWDRFPRIVRDAALASGKKIRLEMSGEDTELDKNIIEAIKDPLTHLIRNCIDHGIETIEDRGAAGKPEEGVIRLRAFHEGGLVQIEVSDDGGGIRPEAIREAALRRGLVSPVQAAAMTEHQIIQLIFMPGFSTAREVTRLSGRGVGLDVVKTNLERISGMIDISSTPGEGTVFKIKIPLTLAIISALIVASGEERFAIPQGNLLEIVRLSGVDDIRKIESVHEVAVYRLRGRLLPVFDLREIFGVPARPLPADPEDQVIHLVVLEADDKRFGLMVDAVQDTQQVVVKPVGREVKSIGVYAGATILGDGRIGLILDILGIAAHARLDFTLFREEAEPVAAEPASDSESLLLFDLDANHRCAVPLSQVTRLEEFEMSQIEWEAGNRVVQYGGGIMSLVDVDRLLCRTTDFPASLERVSVVVHSRTEGRYGLMVTRIADITREPIVLLREGLRPGVLGSAVIHQRVTEILDLETLIKLDRESGLRPAQAEKEGVA